MCSGKSVILTVVCYSAVWISQIMIISPIYKHLGSFQTLALTNSGHKDIWNMSFRERMCVFFWMYKTCSALIDTDSLPKCLNQFLTAGCENLVAPYTH